MPVEENMTLAYRFMEARVKGNLDIVDEMIAPTSSIRPTASRPRARPRGLKMGYRPILCSRLQLQRTRRGSGSRRRQGGDPLYRARNPRPRGAYGSYA